MATCSRFSLGSLDVEERLLLHPAHDVYSTVSVNGYREKSNRQSGGMADFVGCLRTHVAFRSDSRTLMFAATQQMKQAEGIELFF